MKLKDRDNSTLTTNGIIAYGKWQHPTDQVMEVFILNRIEPIYFAYADSSALMNDIKQLDKNFLHYEEFLQHYQEEPYPRRVVP